jgi:tetratricopeptide (TPR) repeat protein
MKKFNTIFFLVLMFTSTGLAQGLTESEKQKVSDKVKKQSVDSALVTAQQIIIGAEVRIEFNVKPQERSDVIKSLYVALEVLNAIEYKNLKNSDYYSWKAKAFTLLDNNEQAIMQYSRAIEIDPRNVSNLSKRALCKMAIENHFGAIPDLTKAIKLDQINDDLYANRAMCYFLTHQLDNAMSDANKAISLNRKNSYSFLVRGNIHWVTERQEEACLDFTTAGDLGDERAFEFLKEYCASTR